MSLAFLLITNLAVLSAPGSAAPTITVSEYTVLLSGTTGNQLQYRYSGVDYKPYADMLWTPAGVNVLRDSPEDHKHHHALMYAINVNEVNFWEEFTAPGRQQHLGLREMLVESDRAQLNESVNWIDPANGDALFLEEQRRIEVLQTSLPCTLVHWQATFTVPRERGTALLGGSHYHGLGMRFVESMDKTAKFLYSVDQEGEVVRGSEKLTPGGWCAVQGMADDKPITVAMFDHPSNARAALWFTMTDPFAYLSATMNLYREPIEVKHPASFVIQYGVAAFDGAVDAAQIQRAYESWLEVAGAGAPAIATAEKGNQP
ncbi:MAG: PmoA family protein [Candidatus Hydrogenedentes bacterium]|nr:PmoA family protein [Candidatus Hydrogenedentota bacterium]